MPNNLIIDNKIKIKRNSLIDNKYEGIDDNSEILKESVNISRRHNDSKSKIYNLKATNINNRIKEYVDILYEKYNAEKDEKLNYQQFKSWVKLHPKLLNKYEQSFRGEIWKVEQNNEMGLVPSFKMLKKNAEGMINITIRTNNLGDRFCFVYKKFLFIFKSETDKLPESIIIRDYHIKWNFYYR